MDTAVLQVQNNTRNTPNFNKIRREEGFKHMKQIHSTKTEQKARMNMKLYMKDMNGFSRCGKQVWLKKHRAAGDTVVVCYNDQSTKNCQNSRYFKTCY